MNARSHRTTARLLILVVATLAMLSTSCTWIIRVSVQDGGGQVTGVMSSVDVSLDGRWVVFATTAQMSPSDTNGVSDVFLRDTAAGTTTGITQYNAASLGAVISDDGSKIAFHSAATNVIVGDTNGVTDVFVFDIASGITSRVSESTLGAEGNGASSDPSISDDGSHIAFQSDATNLVVTDTNGATDIFVNNGPSTSLVSRATSGLQGNGNSVAAAIAGDESVIVFTSSATNLVSSDNNGVDDVFRRTTTGITTRISTTSGAGEVNGASGAPAVNADGSVMAFHSSATNLVAGDTNAQSDVFVKLATGVTERVSLDDAGAQLPSYSFAPSLDNTGDRVAMATAPSNVGGSGPGTTAIVRDRAESRTDLAARDELGFAVGEIDFGPAISGDGRYVGFMSSTALVSGDTNGTPDVFLSDHVEPRVTSVVPNVFPQGQTTVITAFGSGFRDSTLFDNLGGNNTGVTYDNIQVLSANQIQAEVTVTPAASLGARNIWVMNQGTGPGSDAGGQTNCTGCVTIS